LLQALCGRHGEAPLPVLAPACPADCFAIILEAVRLAVTRMTPVIVLADGYLAHGAEAWRIPELPQLPRGPVAEAARTQPFAPYARNEQGGRPWATPGTAGFEHRTGGLEKEVDTGNVSYDPLNHEAMVRQRALKINGIAQDIPELEVDDPGNAEVLVIGWGSTRGATTAAVERCRQRGAAVALAHLRHLQPLPRNTGAILRRYRKVLVPELNTGQLLYVLRSLFLIDAVGLNKFQGRPFLVGEIEHAIMQLVRG